MSLSALSKHSRSPHLRHARRPRSHDGPVHAHTTRAQLICCLCLAIRRSCSVYLMCISFGSIAAPGLGTWPRRLQICMGFHRQRKHTRRCRPIQVHHTPRLFISSIAWLICESSHLVVASSRCPRLCECLRTTFVDKATSVLSA
jgi:hypothetical protein